MEVQDFFCLCKIYHQLGYKLIAEMYNNQKCDFTDLCITKLENTPLGVKSFFDKSLSGYSLNLVQIKID